MILLEIAKKIIPRVTGKAALYLDAANGRLRATRHSGTTWEGEDTARRGQANGYPSLNSSGYVPHGQLGSGGGGTTRFLREDNSWQTVSGGSDHAGLTSLAWASSGHTGTASRLAGFNGSGAASYSQIGVDVQAYDAGLASLTSADGSAGLPYVSGANVWASATYTSQLSVVSGAWKVVGLYETGGPTTLSVGSIPDGYFLKRSSNTLIGVAGTAVSGYYGDPFSIWMGAGAKGNVTFDGTTAVTGFSLASRVYTATSVSSLSYATLTLDTSGGDIEIIAKGVPIRAQTVTGVGSGTATISFNGSAGSGTVGGAAAAALTNAPQRGGAAGANGRTTSGTGSTASGPVNGVGVGGQGGHGGRAGANAGGNSGSASRRWDDGIYGDLLSFFGGMSFLESGSSSYVAYQITGGSGGGSGGCAITSGSWSSGGGGGSAGALYCAFGAISLGSVTLRIQANGGVGADGSGSGSGSAGGGEGGGGGGVFFAARSITGTVTVEAKGANGGNGAGTTAAGGDGASGGTVVAVYGTGTAPTVSVAGGTKGTDVGSPAVPAADGAAGLSVLRQL